MQYNHTCELLAGAGGGGASDTQRRHLPRQLRNVESKIKDQVKAEKEVYRRHNKHRVDAFAHTLVMHHRQRGHDTDTPQPLPQPPSSSVDQQIHTVPPPVRTGNVRPETHWESIVDDMLESSLIGTPASTRHVAGSESVLTASGSGGGVVSDGHKYTGWVGDYGADHTRHVRAHHTTGEVKGAVGSNANGEGASVVNDESVTRQMRSSEQILLEADELLEEVCAHMRVCVGVHVYKWCIMVLQMCTYVCVL